MPGFNPGPGRGGQFRPSEIEVPGYFSSSAAVVSLVNLLRLMLDTIVKKRERERERYRVTY